MISGGADPVTASRYSRDIAAGLSQSLHLLVDDTAHADLFPGCAETVIAEFIDRGSVDGLDVECLLAYQRPAFAKD